jgi:hypothetical protein
MIASIEVQILSEGFVLVVRKGASDEYSKSVDTGEQVIKYFSEWLQKLRPMGEGG